MSNPKTIVSPLFRLPRELRDQIYTNVFATAPMEWLVANVEEHFPNRICFPDHWTKDHNHDSSTFLHNFPALCCASRQLFYECTPKFLTRVEAFTIDIRSTKLLYNWLAQFPNNEGFKAIRDYACYEWNVFNAEVTRLHCDMLTRLTNVKHLHLSFTFPDIIDGMEDAKYDWEDEQEVYIETGLTYSPKLYYTSSPEIWRAEPPHLLTKYPPTSENLMREAAMLQEKLEEFVETHRLRMLFDLPKLQSFEFEFDATGKGRYRHNLCNPLYCWFRKESETKRRDIIITTGYHEEFS